MHWPDHGPDNSRGGMLSVKQLGGKYRVPVSLTTQRELPGLLGEVTLV
jgi:hypothetical protein